jgi:hypothetical protein
VLLLLVGVVVVGGLRMIWTSSTAAAAATATAVATIGGVRGVGRLLFMGWLFGVGARLFLLLGFARSADWSVSATADFNGTVCRGVFQDHASFAQFKNFIIAHRNEERFWFFERAEEKRMAEGNNFDGVNMILFLAADFATADDEFAPFAGCDHCFDDGFSCKMHWIVRML